MQKTATTIAILAIFILLLVGCNSEAVDTASVTPSPTSTITPTPTATLTPTRTPTPTPAPATLNIPLQKYQAPDELFTLNIPKDWSAFEIGGGVRFLDENNQLVSLTAFYYPLPAGVDPQNFLAEEAERVLASARLNDPNSLQVITNEMGADGHWHLEAVGQFFPDWPLLHLRTETWVENNVLLGLSLLAPDFAWYDVEPLWQKALSSYQVLQTDPNTTTGRRYVHPGGLFTITVPVNWGISFEDYDGVILQDMQGLAQFGVSVEEMDHYPTPKELKSALQNMLGDTPQAEGYIELEKDTTNPHLQFVKFEAPAGEDGIYRTELRVSSDRNLLITTSFSVPPHDWEIYQPDYELLLNSIKTRGNAPPDEKTQKKNPLAGIEVGVPMFYLDRQGNLQVSAPIRNFRSHNITNLSASIKLFDKNGKFLAAESWRMLQEVLGQGRTTYLYLALPPETTDLKQVADVKIQLMNSKDTNKQPYPSWSYQSGSARITDKGDVIIDAMLQNQGKKTQKYIFLAALLYDEQGNLVFAKTERQRLPYATPSGQSVDVEITIPGPFPALSNFDILGERPLLD